MSTPFPLEEQNQEQPTALWNPWDGPTKPGFWAGAGFNEDTAYVGPVFTALQAMGSGAAKGAAILNGAEKSIYGGLGDLADTIGVSSKPFRYLEQGAQANTDTSCEMVKRLTPDAATTGTAMNLLHGVTEGAYLMSTGAALGGVPGAAAVVGGTEGGSRYQELREAGVDQTTAAASGILAGATSAAGAVMPAAYGSTLLTRVLTGAASNTAFGILDRYADHKILELGGYPEMAEQQKALDSTQILIDFALGATFGGIHHLTAGEEGTAKALQSPDNRDAALAANLGLRDRQTAPGVPADPEAASLHQAALDKAMEDVLQDHPVDVSDTGVQEGKFLSRPERDFTPEQRIILDAFKESGLFDEEARLKDLQESLEGRLEPEEREPRTQEQIDEAEKIPTDPIAAALNERPNLKIATEDGSVKASDALEKAKEDAATASDEIPKATQAAVACASRRGS